MARSGGRVVLQCVLSWMPMDAPESVELVRDAIRLELMHAEARSSARRGTAVHGRAAYRTSELLIYAGLDRGVTAGTHQLHDEAARRRSSCCAVPTGLLALADPHCAGCHVRSG